MSPEQTDNLMKRAGLPSVKFENIREHAGSQHRAWEELAYFLAPSLDNLPADCRLIRRGTPDGGVEFHCNAPKGEGVWAWQAKYLFELTASSYKQMTKSFKDALENVPNLSRYTFILPIDRPAGASGTSALEKWNQKVQEWTDFAAGKGVKLVFDYHGHSDVLQAIIQPEHAGARRYFFGSTPLTPGACSEQVDHATKNLGDRYLPKTNVETDFASVIDSLCLAPSFKNQINDLASKSERALERLVHALATETNLSAPKAVAAAKAMSSAWASCKGLLEIDDGSTLPALQDAVDKGKDAVRADWTEFEQSDSKHDRHKAFNPREELHRTYLALQSLDALISNSALRLASDKSLLVVGAAGVGKSHSLADVAVTRNRAEAPTLLVLGNHLSHNTCLTDEIAKFIGLGDWNELIAEMQVLAELSGQGKALIAVDAINEGAGRDLWKERLPGLLHEISKTPKVELVLSVRDSYESDVISPTADEALERVVHRGLTGRESEAIHLYAQDAGLAAPHVPPLNPEFSNPLLLRSMCRAAKSRGLTTLPDTSMGEDWIFDGLLKAVNDKICDRNELDLDPADQIVQKGVRAIAAAMVDANSESLSRRTAASIGRTIHADDGRESQRLISVLEREGILLREPSIDSREEVIRFTYQRMSDHYRAQAILDREEDTTSVRASLSDHRLSLGSIDSGLLEALSSMVPVRHGLELFDLVADEPWVERAKYTLGRALLASLAWRPPGTVDERTSELIGDFLAEDVVDTNDWLSTLLSVAFIPDHPLGADYIHERLIDRSMIELDHGWTLHVQQLWLEWDNPIARAIDWLSVNAGDLDPQTRQDAMLVLSWLLSSTSRRLRDVATKLLVKLTDKSANGLLHVLRRMKNVDDPYIRERLAGVALGYASRLPPKLQDSEQLSDAESVHIAALGMASQGTAPSVLLTHYMRELTRELATRLPGVDLTPYQEPACTWPLDPPSRADLATRLGDASDQRFLSNSPIGHDFRTYTLERGVVENFVLPDQAERQQRARRNALQRRRRALNRLAKAEGVASECIEHQLNPPHYKSPLHKLIKRSRMPGSSLLIGDLEDDEEVVDPAQSQGDRLRSQYPNETRRIALAETTLNSPKNIGPSLEMIEQWLIDRVLNLGWTPEIMTDKHNHLINRQLDGAEDKIERVGKKYLWIALRELQAIFAQHCKVSKWSPDDPAVYESLWQLRDGADIDPTIALHGDRAPTESSSTRLRHRRRAEELRDAWWLRGFASSLDPNPTNDDAWLKSETDLPLVNQTLATTDPAGDDWVIVECHAQWESDTNEAVEGFHRDRRQLWVRAQSYLTSAESIPDIRAWSSGQDWMGLWMRTPPDYGEGFHRQYPHAEPWASWFQENQLEHTSGGGDEYAPVDTRRFPISDGWYQPACRDFPQHPQALATFGSNETFEADMSSRNLPSTILPSPTLLHSLGATPTPADKLIADPSLKLGSIEREYSWSNSDGIVMFATGGPDWRAPSALYVRGSVLREALEREGLSWWSWLLGEKITWRRGEPTANRLNVFGAAGLAEDGVEAWSLNARYHDLRH